MRTCFLSCLAKKPSMKENRFSKNVGDCMELGMAKQPITPPMKVRLAGYATRTTPFEGITEDIMLRVQVQKIDQTYILFLYGDLLWWSSDFVQKIRPIVSKTFGVSTQNIFFIASHNHSGPPTGNCFTPILETYDEAYAVFLEKTILETIPKAMEDLSQVEMRLHSGQCAMNVFRRVILGNQVLMRPNYNVKADQALNIVAFYRPNGALKAAMIHYPCHANLANTNVIQPDYPGVALRQLDEAFPESQFIFLQGCTGDLRPNSVLGGQFRPCTYADVVTFATEFAQHCQSLLKEQSICISPKVSIQQVQIPLPLENLKTTKEVESLLQDAEPVVRQWAQKILEKNNRAFETLELSIISYNEDLALYTFNAEVSQYYAEFIKKCIPNGLALGYTNGMIGYLCTAEQIAQGGYEPNGSALYFALAGTYSKDIELIIQQKIEELLLEAVDSR